MAQSESDQGFVDLPLPFEERHPQFVVMMAWAMDLHFLGCERIEPLRALQVPAILGNLRRDRIAWEQVQRNRRLLNQSGDVVRVSNSVVDFAYLQGDSSKQHKGQRSL